MMKRKIFFLMSILFCQIVFAQQSQHKKNNFKTTIQVLAVPTLFITYGLICENENGFPSSDAVKNWRDKNYSSFQTKADDYLVFVPAAMVYGFDMLKVKSEHDLVNQTIIFAKTSLLTMAMVYSLKYTTHVSRPDGSDNQSFPSAHTAMAFAYATVLDKEFKNPWISIAGYSLATATGAMRILNDKHWFSDVVVGAGIGILSTKLVYLTHQNKYTYKGKNNSSILPIIGNQQYGLLWLKQF